MTLLVGAFFLFLILGFPVAFTITMSAGLYLYFANIPLNVVPQRMIAGVDSFSLLAILFFMIAGGFMNAGGITKRLVALSRALVGHIRGGLAQVNIVTSLFFSGISGSAIADTAAIGSTLIPTMVRSGYSRAYSAVVTASSSTIGPIIPPSLALIVYGGLTGTSIGRLFLAGIVPGTLMGLTLMVTAYIIARRRRYEHSDRFDAVAVLRAAKDSLFALLMPVIILGGILGGIFTATEAAVVAAVYAGFVSVFVYRELTVRRLMKVVVESTVSAATILIIIAAASPLAWALTFARAPQQLLVFLTSLTENAWVLLLLLNVALLILGMVMEAFSLIILLVPVLMPIVAHYGIDPVHFGIILVLDLCIGGITPPVGVLMFLSSSIAKIKASEFVLESWPFVLALIVVLIIVTQFPWLSLAPTEFYRSR